MKTVVVWPSVRRATTPPTTVSAYRVTLPAVIVRDPRPVSVRPAGTIRSSTIIPTETNLTPPYVYGLLPPPLFCASFFFSRPPLSLSRFVRVCVCVWVGRISQRFNQSIIYLLIKHQAAKQREHQDETSRTSTDTRLPFINGILWNFLEGRGRRKNRLDFGGDRILSWIIVL